MSQPPSRSIIGVIYKNFINSFKSRQTQGTLIGADHFGNKYYEIPADPSRGKRKPSRWFAPSEEEDFDQEVPAEWEAWLRGRRKEPPPEEEVLKNLAIMQMKKINAAKLEEKYTKPDDAKLLPKEIKGAESFPKYEEFELIPGKARK